ncbi:P-loop containing nucleoside triphosphate hydrolase protein [Lentinula aff. lateritia]|uniref:P-loop containing nucleoside triphosphate hydrolase protein n=1 Tax=Lentinula aff. lateritia TaxID=2804960 RepID=A0ACC1UDI6_9AGAR|nr:P-loop containing nucleoside triphosphate hydrolase protein [Lentinula aff. lateritia]
MSGSNLPAIDIQQLTFAHTTPGALPSDKPFIALRDVHFSLPRGSRTLLIGGNGAGKMLGRDVFKDFPPNVVYLGTEWAMNTETRGGYRHKAHRDHLLDILDINLDWHMYHISDGERRRVQLCMGLMGEWDVLLLDEVTVDLDVLVRDQLLEFLQQETIERNATVVYATHIFNGLNTFPMHIAHMCDGQFTLNPIPWPLQDLDNLLEDPKAKEHFLKSGLSIHALALTWLSNDRTARTIPSDSETFYKKYDYSR